MCAKDSAASVFHAFYGQIGKVYGVRCSPSADPRRRLILAHTDIPPSVSGRTRRHRTGQRAPNRPHEFARDGCSRENRSRHARNPDCIIAIRPWRRPAY
jgi:hypothetical protein